MGEDRIRPMTLAEATAPTRIDLAGGTLDIWPVYLFHPGAVTVNVAIDRRAWCRVETGHAGLRIESKDTLTQAEGATVADVIGGGSLSLVAFILRALRIDLTLALEQTALLTIMLAYQAWLMCDAILRTLWRVFVSHRHLLEWVPADLLGNSRSDFRSFYARMARSIVLTLALGVASAALAGGMPPPIALPFLGLWLIAPAIAWRISHVMSSGPWSVVQTTGYAAWHAASFQSVSKAPT